MTIHIADKVKTLMRMRKRLQGQHSHLRPQVGAADADVDDVGDRVVGANLLSVSQHGIERGVDLGKFFGFQRAGGGCIGRRAQQHMPDRALLGGVDGLSRKHRVPVRRHAALLGQFQQQLRGRRVDQVFGQVAENIGRLLAEVDKALRIRSKRLAQVERAPMRVVCGLQAGPDGCAVATQAGRGSVHGHVVVRGSGR